jgi:hypothetical protein
MEVTESLMLIEVREEGRVDQHPEVFADESVEASLVVGTNLLLHGIDVVAAQGEGKITCAVHCTVQYGPVLLWAAESGVHRSGRLMSAPISRRGGQRGSAKW